MKNVFLETGKALLIFANLATILLFLKKFFMSGNNIDLLWSVAFFIGTYIVANSFIYISNFMESENGN